MRRFKKRVATIFFVIGVLALSGCGSENIETAVEEVDKKSDIKEITISCAGDCTLGTDAAFGGITFPVEVENQGKDYGFFMRNVKPYFENDAISSGQKLISTSSAFAMFQGLLCLCSESGLIFNCKFLMSCTPASITD